MAEFSAWSRWIASCERAGAMANLDDGSERVARLAAEEFMHGSLRSAVDEEVIFETQNNRYRVLDGVCFDATADGYVGAELVGWLFEGDRMSAVSAWWRRGARAVLVVRAQREEIVVTSPTVSLVVGGRPARDGFATQRARFIVVRPPDDSPASVLEPAEDPAVAARDVRPSTPAAEPMRMILPRVPLLVAPDAVAALHGHRRPQVWLPPVSPPPPHCSRGAACGPRQD